MIGVGRSERSRRRSRRVGARVASGGWVESSLAGDDALAVKEYRRDCFTNVSV